MKRILLAIPFFVAVASANPISGYLVFPPHTMVAENVLVGVAERGAVVTGRYRFRVTPDAPEHWVAPPYTLAVQVPVPIPASLTKFEEIEAEAHPFITLKGVRYEPAAEVFFYDVPSLPRAARLAVFYFRIDREDLEEEFELVVQYHQPVISVDGRDLVYYIPFLPTFETYKKKMGLREDSYLISFEAHGPIDLILASRVLRVERESATFISVRPRHMEVIAIERRAQPASQPTAGR